MPIILVTGFEPFGGDPRNPSREIALAIDGRILLGRRVVGAVLPCVFDRSIHALQTLLAAHRPEFVVCLGVAGNRQAITPERIAINLDDAPIPDNAGAQPIDRPIVPGAPAAYWTTLPIKTITTSLRTSGLPAEVSQTAGTFVCNHVFYGLMHALRDVPETRGGFVHVPFETPHLTVAAMTTGLVLAIEAALEAGSGARETEGRLS